MSPPHNGEAANETFFVTMDDWQDTLRVTHFPPCRRVLLMSDGVTGFAALKATAGLEPAFMAPVDRCLAQAEPAVAFACLRHGIQIVDGPCTIEAGSPCTATRPRGGVSGAENPAILPAGRKLWSAHLPAGAFGHSIYDFGICRGSVWRRVAFCPPAKTQAACYNPPDT
ncbi:protein phosphatase 2C domain-containing protein [Rhodopila globiformis]|uniref:protein phosphatase 2C domain-containing protein n=1 Tax=Rhodopila globiformis TaxID=1071 RepID=UPI001304FF46|nr:protein phosphatase 2C domain-containing protein [Rhodopila globiformis]